MKGRSILTEDFDKCYICGGRAECVHHIFPGTAKRKISDDNGFTAPLCNRCHNMSDHSVHFDSKLALKLKKDCQRAYQELGHTKGDFVRLVGRNYL